MKQLLGNKKKILFSFNNLDSEANDFTKKKDKNRSFKSRSLLDEKQELFQLKCFV